KVRYRQPPDVDHCLSESRFHDAVAHADDEEQEEGERVPGCVENGDDDQEHLGANVRSVVVHVFWASVSSSPPMTPAKGEVWRHTIEAPGHQHLDHEEDEDG